MVGARPIDLFIYSDWPERVSPRTKNIVEMKTVYDFTTLPEWS